MRLVKIIFIFAILLTVAAFLTQNPQLSTSAPLRLDLLVWGMQSSPIPVYFLIIFSFMAGLLIGLLYLTIDRFGARTEIKARDKRIRELETLLAQTAQAVQNQAASQPGPDSTLATPNQGQSS